MAAGDQLQAPATRTDSNPAVQETSPIRLDTRVSQAPPHAEIAALLGSILVVAACGLIYELLIATVSSYLLGSSVTQFSISIGLFIGAMGLGSHLSQKVERNVLAIFVLIQIALGIIGGTSVALLLIAYSAGFIYWIALYGVLIAIGSLTGLELPLLTRLLKEYGELRTVIAQAFSFDYLGALAGSLLFPLLLLPTLGMARTAFIVGLVNVGVAGWNARVFRRRLRWPHGIIGLAVATASVLTCGFIFSFQIVHLLESHLYEDEIIFAKQTPYQRIVVTRWRDDVRLFLDGNLQFSSTDEYRYHEALIHPALSRVPSRDEILILGGGDGLAIREVLKDPTVKHITLVDIDPAMTDLSRTYPAFTELNHRSLQSPKVTVIHQDAYKYLEQNSKLYDVVFSDMPDPNTHVLAKLYSLEFFQLIKHHLSASGVFVTQATSPFFSREAFWCIARTVESADLHVLPYHVYVPSMGDWGFVMASAHKLPHRTRIGVPTRFVTEAIVRGMTAFGKDASEVSVDISTLDHPVVETYYMEGWKKWE